MTTMPIAASVSRDIIVWIGIPTLVYGAVLAGGWWILSRRSNRAQGAAFGAPALGAVLLIALALSLFAAIGTDVAEGRNPNADSFVGWGRMILVGLYGLVVVVAALTARALARRPGAGGVKVASAAIVAVFVFVVISAPFSAVVNACHVGNPILINAQVNCSQSDDEP
ncbi:MAG: hypothetical protein ACR2OD_03305 [Gaiellaceae bacterium]